MSSVSIARLPISDLNTNKSYGIINYTIFYFRDYLEEDIFGENEENDWAANDDDMSDGKYEFLNLINRWTFFYLDLIQYNNTYYLFIAVSDEDNSKEGNLSDDYENNGNEYSFEDTDSWLQTNDESDAEEDVADIWGSDDYDYKWYHSKPLSTCQILLTYYIYIFRFWIAKFWT